MVGVARLDIKMALVERLVNSSTRNSFKGEREVMRII